MSFDDPEFTNERHERRVTRCRSCRARIIWLSTDAGKSMPCDADSVEPDDEQYEHGRHVSHFSTYPNSEQHLRPR